MSNLLSCTAKKQAIFSLLKHRCRISGSCFSHCRNFMVFFIFFRPFASGQQHLPFYIVITLVLFTWLKIQSPIITAGMWILMSILFVTLWDVGSYMFVTCLVLLKLLSFSPRPSLHFGFRICVASSMCVCNPLSLIWGRILG